MGISHIIDRRLNGKNKSAVNRDRFLRRYRAHIKKAMAEAVGKRSITDMDRGHSISIPSKDLDEPVFHSGKGGLRETVNPGNKEFISGDQLPKPPGGQGEGGSGEGKASDSGEGMDEFAFQISQEEFLDFMFEDLALPNLIKKQLKDTTSYKYLRAGYSSQGNPSKINIVRSLKKAYGRRIALTGKTRDKIKALEEQIKNLDLDNPIQAKHHKELEVELTRLKKRIHNIPWIDEFDLRYNQHIKHSVPSTSAVMFCLMDVSGSMTQMHKDIAKRFYVLLYLFLKRNYQKIDVVFIRHHTSAKEVDEEEFFYSRETGGTIVSSALHLTQEIINKRYPASDWNIYAAQASDGDNWNDDSPLCSKILIDKILPQLQYYAYIEITQGQHQSLWEHYTKVKEQFEECFSMQNIQSESDIYPVFRELFQRRPA
ncbi:MAG: uncharacterized sporulation protein YeaH/YhbH (DUF444 family) [Oleiphilaceae bacterium]|jgi:uncharacterized sporulation protein YeaH/YhbH (DUF444 family)